MRQEFSNTMIVMANPERFAVNQVTLGLAPIGPLHVL